MRRSEISLNEAEDVGVIVAELITIVIGVLKLIVIVPSCLYARTVVSVFDKLQQSRGSVS